MYDEEGRLVIKTVAEVEAFIAEEIKPHEVKRGISLGNSPEAHGNEDELYHAVIESIAKGRNIDNADLLCKAALHTRLINFSRWTE